MEVPVLREHEQLEAVLSGLTGTTTPGFIKNGRKKKVEEHKDNSDT